MAKNNNAIIEQAYNTIYDYLMNKSETKGFWRALYEKNIDGKKNSLVSTENDLYITLMDLKEVIAYNTAKEAGNGNIRKGMMNIIKSAKKAYRTNLDGAYKDEEGFTVVCDGYRIVKTKRDVDLPMLKMEDGQKWIDYNAICNKGNRTRTVALPSLSELKLYIKTNKNNPEAQIGSGNKDVFYILKNENGEAIVAYDAQYLADVLECFEGTNYCSYIPSEKARIGTLYIEGEEGTEAVLCAIRINDGKEMNYKWEDDEKVAY